MRRFIFAGLLVLLCSPSFGQRIRLSVGANTTAADGDGLIAFPVADSTTYGDFAAYVATNFYPSSDSTYSDALAALAYVDAGEWHHDSQNAVSIAFETTHPCQSYVEYGATSSYGSKTTQTSELHFLHLHYVAGLSASQTIHYRFVAINEAGSVIRSVDKTTSTEDFSGSSYIAIPGALSGPPYILNQANKTYYFTQNVTANTRGITVAAAGVNIDLNGFTLTYDNGSPIVPSKTDQSTAGGANYPAWTDYVYSNDSTMGIVHSSNDYHGTIFNGKIVQAQAHNGTIGVGFNPLFMGSYPPTSVGQEVAGLTVEWKGASVNGLHSTGGDLHVHHNLWKAHSTVINDRSLGVFAIKNSGANNQDLHHNLIQRVQHCGIEGQGGTMRVYKNEIYGDSYRINSYLVRGVGSVYSNWIFGTGYHTCAISAASPAADLHDNIVFMRAEAPAERDTEYGVAASVNGFRLTQYYGSHVVLNYHAYNNVVIVKARDGDPNSSNQNARGFEIMTDPTFTILIENNIVKAETLNADSLLKASCIVVQGTETSPMSNLPAIYRNNTFLSNGVHVKINDGYTGGGHRHWFYGNTFTKFGILSGYRMVSAGPMGDAWNGLENKFIDSILSGGADFDTNGCNGNPPIGVDYSVGHRFYIRALSGSTPLSGATITVSDNGPYASSVTTDSNGYAVVELLDYCWYAQSDGVWHKVNRTGHRLSLSGYSDHAITSGELSNHNTSSSRVDIAFTAEEGVK